MKLNAEIFEIVVAKIIEEGGPDDMTKFMLSGKESIVAVQRYFDLLETHKKKELTLIGDEWFLNIVANDYMAVKHTGLSMFKIIAPSIIPSVKMLQVFNTQLEDYSFLRYSKHLFWLELKYADQKYLKVLSGLSNLQSVEALSLDIKHLDLQLLSSLSFSFNYLDALNFVFETDPKCEKVFQAQNVQLYGDEELKHDFVFNRQHYQNYAAIFPNARYFSFEFYINVVDDVSGLLELSSYAAEIEIPNRKIMIEYRFFDYSGYPDSKVLKMLQDDGRWDTENCPYRDAMRFGDNVDLFCSFPLAIADVANRLAKKSLYRVPENNNGNPEDYHRVTIENSWEHKAEFEILKSVSTEELVDAYGKITGIDPENLRCYTDLQNISNGDVIYIRYYPYFN